MHINYQFVCDLLWFWWQIAIKISNSFLFIYFSLSQTSKFGHILVVSDEDGYVTLFDTRRNFPVTANFEENSGFFAFFFVYHEINIMEITKFYGFLCENLLSSLHHSIYLDFSTTCLRRWEVNLKFIWKIGLLDSYIKESQIGTQK